MLRGLEFETWTAPVDRARNRVDVACFVGLARRSERALPPLVLAWLAREGWVDAPGQPKSEDVRFGDTWALDDSPHLPIPIDDWSAFKQLFRGRSTAADGASEVDYLAAAVRSFFVQGGRRCYVVAVGAPMAWDTERVQRLEALPSILPQLSGNVSAISATERRDWRGVGVLHGVEEASWLALPDLPFLAAADIVELEPFEPEEQPFDAFEECSEHLPEVPETVRSRVAAPRCDSEEYREWATWIATARRFLQSFRRDMQLVAAVPLPQRGSWAARDLLGALAEWRIWGGSVVEPEHAFASRFVQLVYPWLRWSGSAGLPEDIEPPDGTFLGVLARATLQQGAYRSAVGQPIRELRSVVPPLSRAQQEQEGPDGRVLLERISLLGPSVEGPTLLSDVTSAEEEVWRTANIVRLHAVWIRALRQAGETMVFEPSSETVWAAVRDRVDQVGRILFRDGALRGRSADESFSVRCDRNTMSQADIDAGRLVAEVGYLPAAPVERIFIALALSEDQRVDVVRELAEGQS
ncbi:MAG: phage tail sheath protein [Myxococcota bacterium]